MDLEQYKKVWDNQPEEIQKVSKKEIYKMTHAKSSSIVKWIFIIGLIEFILLTAAGLFIEIEDDIHNLPHKNLLLFIEIFSYPVAIFFVIKFYINYKRISTVDNTKKLMHKILKTRRTVKLYVLVNLLIAFFIYLIFMYDMLKTELENESTVKIVSAILLMTLFIALLLLIIWAFYQLLYGILLRKLNVNYKELANLES